MTAFIVDIAAFAIKALLVAVYVASVLAMIALLLARRRGPSGDDEGTLVVSRLDHRHRKMADTIRRLGMSDKETKALDKALEDAREEEPARTVFVTDFHGDLNAGDVEDLRKVVTAIVGAARDRDEVVLRLRSPGGTVPGYGLASAQLQRLRDAGIRLTVCVDTVAASGGYMMAVVSDELVAAPFAVVGSIGVYLPVPNVNRLLKEHGVDVQELTSGRYKRTVSVLGELDDEGIAKTQQMLDETHELFKRHVSRHRPDVDIEAVSTGEYWYGDQAVEIGLVDRVGPSDDVLVEKSADARLVRVEIRHDQRIGSKLAHWLGIAGRWARR